MTSILSSARHTSRPRPIIRRRSRRIALLASALVLASGCAVSPAHPTSERAVRSDPVHAVYEFEGTPEQASALLRHVRNHLAADPQARIVVVGIGAGIDFLLRDALDKGGYPFELVVADLAQQGVVFDVCDNSLRARSKSREQVIEHVTVVPSGVAEVARLQWRLGYAYLKPQ